MRLSLILGTVLLAAAASWHATALAEPAASKSLLNTIADIQRALRACWQWPPASESRSHLALTVRVSFKHNDEILGARITYQSQAISDDDRVAYYGALLQTLKRCSPLPLSAGLGGAIAGRPLTFHIQDTRQQRKA